MKLPRDMGGQELSARLGRYGYSIMRQTGSHIRLTSTYTGKEHHVTIPSHNPLKIGTLSSIIDDVAVYLKVERRKLIEELFR